MIPEDLDQLNVSETRSQLEPEGISSLKSWPLGCVNQKEQLPGETIGKSTSSVFTFLRCLDPLYILYLDTHLDYSRNWGSPKSLRMTSLG